VFDISLETLRPCPQGSLMGTILSRGAEAEGAYFLDRDGQTFEHVLRYLRDGDKNFELPEDPVEKRRLANEADLLGLPTLADLVRRAYKGAPLPANDDQRTARLNEMHLSHEEEDIFDSITRSVAALTNHDTVRLCIIDKTQQWCKSQAGKGECQRCQPVPRNESICANTLLPEDPRQASMLVIKDLREDPRTETHPLILVADEAFLSYAGAPIVSADGFRLGALSVLDRKTRELTHAEAQVICSFANIIAQEIERPLLLRAARKATTEHMEETTCIKDAPDFTHGDMRRERMLDALDEVVCLIQAEETLKESTVLWANRKWTSVMGARIVPPASLPGDSKVHFIEDDPFTGTTKALSEHRAPQLSEWLSMDDAQWHSISKELHTSLAADEPWEIALESARLSVKKTGNLGPIQAKVICRFVPVELPLDVNAAAVKIVASKRSGRSGSPLGTCSWLTMMFVKPKEVWKDMSGSDWMRSSSSSPSSSRQDRVRRPTALTPFMDVRIMTLLQAGGFTKAYYGLLVGCPVLVKLVERPITKQSQQRGVLDDLAQLTLQHPNLVKTYRYIEQEKHGGWAAEEEEMLQTWIVQEWCELGTLESVCKTNRMNSHGEQEVMRIINDITRAGKYLHQNGVLHGDLRPANVLLKRKLSRWGFTCKVCAVGTRRGLDFEMNSDGDGSALAYIPPEVFREAGSLTQKADVYSVGVIMFELVIGCQAFDGSTPKEVVQLVARGVGLQLPEGCSGELRMLFNQLTNQNPDQRPVFDDVVQHVKVIFKTLDSRGRGAFV